MADGQQGLRLAAASSPSPPAGQPDRPPTRPLIRGAAPSHPAQGRPLPRAQPPPIPVPARTPPRKRTHGPTRAPACSAHPNAKAYGRLTDDSHTPPRQSRRTDDSPTLNDTHGVGRACPTPPSALLRSQPSPWPYAPRSTLSPQRPTRRRAPTPNTLATPTPSPSHPPHTGGANPVRGGRPPPPPPSSPPRSRTGAPEAPPPS